MPRATHVMLAVALAVALGSAGAAAPTDATTVPHFANCKLLNARYPHGVGLPGARDRTSGTPVTTFTRNRAVYLANKARDRDKDGIACEKR